MRTPKRSRAILPKLFENDASSARPEGSMAVLKVIWWKHKPGKMRPVFLRKGAWDAQCKSGWHLHIE